MTPYIESNPDVTLCEEYDGMTVLFDPTTGTGFELNAVGLFVWRHLDGRHSLDQIVRSLQHEFNEVPDEAVRDVEELIRRLVSRGLAGYVFPLSHEGSQR